MRQRSPTLLALLVVLLLLPATASAACRGVDQRPSGSSSASQKRATACLINEARHRRGLPALRTDPRLAAAALAHAQDMVRRRFFDHVTPDGLTLVDRVRAAGYLSGAGDWSVAEDIAWGSSGATPRSIVRGWMQSPPHRAAILNAGYRNVGVGMARGNPGQPGAAVTFTATFGRRG